MLNSKLTTPLRIRICPCYLSFGCISSFGHLFLERVNSANSGRFLLPSKFCRDRLSLAALETLAVSIQDWHIRVEGLWVRIQVYVSRRRDIVILSRGSDDRCSLGFRTVAVKINHQFYDSTLPSTYKDNLER